ncbi:MAG: DNA-binding transcriptional MerR regulator [Planctomycetaceae bacterium]|jgi:DNA-binding transcriptional MerR regulator
MVQQYSISDLSLEFSVTTRTLRFYEEKGLLNPKRDGQKRWYSVADRTRLVLILRGKRLGLSLQESSEIIGLYDPSSNNEQQLLLLIDRIQHKKLALERQRQDIDDMIREMDQWLERYHQELKANHCLLSERTGEQSR